MNGIQAACLNAASGDMDKRETERFHRFPLRVREKNQAKHMKLLKPTVGGMWSEQCGAKSHRLKTTKPKENS